MTVNLSTGDTRAIRKNLLNEVAQYLVRSCGYLCVETLRDMVGIYAKLMKDQHGNKFFLIAKGSELWRDVVSCQAFLPVIAKNNHINTQIVLAWYPPTKSARLKLYQFDPYKIIQEKYGYNNRQGVRMINFSIRLGELFDPLKGVMRAQQSLTPYITTKT